MKKVLIVFILSIIALQLINAQTAAIDETLEYQKGQNKRAVVIELPYPPETVEDAIKQEMANRGIKPEKLKGDVLVYRSVRIQNDTEFSDLHFKVERKSKKEKDVSKVHLIVGRANENVALRDQNDAHRSEKGKSFLNNLSPIVAAHQLEIEITEQAELIAKTEKKIKGLTEDQKDYEKKISGLEVKLAENKKEQEVQTAEAAKLRSALDAMQARRTL